MSGSTVAGALPPKSRLGERLEQRSFSPVPLLVIQGHRGADQNLVKRLIQLASQQGLAVAILAPWTALAE
eukprot:6491354-Amphidinium_carterae.2